MNRRLYLFDCDGTILDSVGIIHDSMARTFVEFGHRPPEQIQTRSIIGLTLDLAIARLRGAEIDAEITGMTARYKEIFNEIYHAPGFSQSLFDGMGAVVENLAARTDAILGVVTGKSRRGMDMFFTSHGMRHCFRPIRTADDCPSKPHPAMVEECCTEVRIAPAQTTVIGDSVFDMQMAKSAGARAIGVAWGYNAVPQLLAAGADAIAEDAGHLMELLEQSHA
ncbi:MAG: HAD-IA family hydrolase [Rhizobiaceae bacterium]